MPGLKSRRAQAGLALLEALIALAILASALLGMLYVQLRTLADTESTTRRAQALRLIDDLADRIQSNPEGYAQLAGYRSNWASSPGAVVDCELQWCDPKALADWDLARWKVAVARTLPLGDATVFDVAAPQPEGTRRSLGVMVGWRANTSDSFAVEVPGATCPTGLVCHFGHVQP